MSNYPFKQQILYFSVTKTVDANSAEAKNIKKEEVKKTEVKPAVKDLGSLG